MDDALRAKIERAAKQWTVEGKMFTAFEISLRLKADGVQERHRNMKQEIHAALARVGGANYSRTLMDVGAPSQAWVYHKLRDNPYTYEPLDRSGFRDNKGVAKPAGEAVKKRVVKAQIRNPKPLGPGSSNSPASNADGAYGLDVDGKLKIPDAMLMALKVAFGDKVSVVCDKANKQVRIRRLATINPEPATHELTADDSSEDGAGLAMSHEILEEADLHSLQSYLVQGTGNMITVREFPDS